MTEEALYHASVDIKESGTNQKPAIHVSVTTNQEDGGILLAKKALQDYMLMVRAIRPHDMVAKTYLDVTMSTD